MKGQLFAVSVIVCLIVVVLVMRIATVNRTNSNAIILEEFNSPMNGIDFLLTSTIAVEQVESTTKHVTENNKEGSVTVKTEREVSATTKTENKDGTTANVASNDGTTGIAANEDHATAKAETDVTTTGSTPVNTQKTVNKNRETTNAVNPGCKARQVSKYEAPDTGKTYIHTDIVHFTKFNKTSFNALVFLNFREYISVLSVHKFLKPKKIMFHTYTNFSGHYWDKVQGLKNINIEVNVISPFTEIGGKRTVYVEHQADYTKLSMVYKYGGTALDFDVIMINGTRWRYLQKKSECVLVEEPGVINGGLYSCVQNSPFLAKWLEGYHKDYRPNDWLYNASFRPKDLLQSHVCYNVHVDRTVCIDPTYFKRHLWLKVNGANWRSKTGAHYYIKSGIPNDGEGLLKEKFSLAELIQHVYNA